MADGINFVKSGAKGSGSLERAGADDSFMMEDPEEPMSLVREKFNEFNELNEFSFLSGAVTMQGGEYVFCAFYDVLIAVIQCVFLNSLDLRNEGA